MAKPRIIIADTDFSYIIALQYKFVKEFLNKVHLEIIDNEEYFDELFSTPQKADILIVSENLYSLSLQRHNIGHIFLMSEKADEDNTVDLSVTRLFKYSNIKEIFNEISGKSAESLDIKEKKTEPQIVMVYSATGGVGKTTVALGICACLTKSYKKVLYINASHLHTFQRLLDNPVAITSADVYDSLVKNDSASIYEKIKHALRKEQFYYLPPFRASILSLGIDYSVFKNIAVAARDSGNYDFVVVDADNVFDDANAELIGIADKVITVCEQSIASVFATNLLVSNINGISSEKYCFICNKYNKENENALISPNVKTKFNISEFIDTIKHYDNLKAVDFEAVAGIQKTAILLI